MTDKSMEEQYKAIRIKKHGGPAVLEPELLDKCSPAPEQALIRIAACGVNYIDIYRRKGIYPVDLPYTPGLEAAGVVEEIGQSVTEVRPGDRVAYTGQPGAYAEYSLVDASSLIALPDELTFEEGAAFPLQCMTAHYLIHEYVRIRPAMTVLIHAAAGGMGLLLTQWAKNLHATVIGTVSSEEKELLARENGCDHVINYRERDFVREIMRITGNSGAELIFDGVGKETFPGDLEAVSLRGTIVVFGSASGQIEPISPNLLQKKSITVCGGSLFNYLLDRDELLTRASDAIQAIREGWLKLSIHHRFKLEEAHLAHELMESRKSTGKIILLPEQ